MFKVRKELAPCVHVNFFFSMARCLGPLLALLAAVCLTLPALRTMASLCGELGWWRGRGMDGLERGPPYYPESSGWVPGLGSRFGGGDERGLAVYQSGCQAAGHGAKRGQQATRWQCQVSQTDHFHCAAPQYPPPELECLLAISRCQPPDPHLHHVQNSPTMRRCPGIHKRPPLSSRFKIAQGEGA